MRPLGCEQDPCKKPKWTLQSAWQPGTGQQWETCWFWMRNGRRAGSGSAGEEPSFPPGIQSLPTHLALLSSLISPICKHSFCRAWPLQTRGIKLKQSKHHFFFLPSRGQRPGRRPIWVCSWCAEFWGFCCRVDCRLLLGGGAGGSVCAGGCRQNLLLLARIPHGARFQTAPL